MNSDNEKVLLPFLDFVTSSKYKIHHIIVPPKFHFEFQEFWRSAVNGCSNVSCGHYNCAYIELSDTASRLSVEFHDELAMY